MLTRVRGVGSDEEVLDRLVSLLRAKRIKVTSQRALIAEALAKLDHPTATEIYQYVASRSPIIGIATIYRNLQIFKKLGIVKELSTIKDNSRFEVRTTPHMNIECIVCGRISDLQSKVIDKILEVLKRRGIKVVECEVIVRSICEKCDGRRRTQGRY